MTRKIYIIKANGEKVIFDPNKVISTCMRAGANSELSTQIAQKTEDQLRNGMTTKQVYRIVLSELSKEGGKAVMHRYRLKEAIMLLGPAGFLFQTYVGQILAEYDYEIKAMGSFFDGKCVKHEIDIVANSKSTNKRFMIECKYHNRRGSYTGLKESLYTHARFMDLTHLFDNEMLVSNTKVSNDTLQYAQCIGQHLLCWRHPEGHVLEAMIEEKGLYPITILKLNSKELHAFSKNNMMIAKEILSIDAKKLSHNTAIPQARLQRLQSIIGEIIH